GFPTASEFWHQFLQGYDFAHAGCMSNMFLSWQAVFVGDPLYCPFKSGWKDTQAQNRAAHTGLVSAFESARKRSEPRPLVAAARALLAFGIEDDNAALAHQSLDELGKQAASGLSEIRKLLSSKKTTEAIQRLRAVADTYASLPAGDEAAGLLKTTVAAEDAAAEKIWVKAVEFESKNELARALEKYREIVASFPESTVAEKARAREKELLDDPEKEKLIAAQQREQAAMSIWDKVNSSLKNKREDLARKYLREIVSKYPETEAAARAKDKLSELK
ncbi:MAG: tetratricopeptide repeat protein, partial [Planctomycetota bacterium]|nr:tetratricopeptide repeat protein [Planctomycetota bacterium]